MAPHFVGVWVRDYAEQDQTILVSIFDLFVCERLLRKGTSDLDQKCLIWVSDFAEGIWVRDYDICVMYTWLKRYSLCYVHFL